MQRKLDISDSVLLLGHFLSFLSIACISAGSLLRLIKNNADIPEKPLGMPIPDVANPINTQRRNSYFER